MTFEETWEFVPGSLAERWAQALAEHLGEGQHRWPVKLLRELERLEAEVARLRRAVDIRSGRPKP